MNPSQKFPQTEDPLLAGLKPSRKSKANSEGVDSKGKEGSRGPQILALLLPAAALGVLAYFLLQAQERIEHLNASLASSQSQLNSASQELSTSQARLESLQEGVEKSQSQLRSQKEELHRYRTLYSGLKQEQEQQTRELQAIALQKADQSAVHQLESHLRQEVGQVRSQVGSLKEETARNRTEIETTQADLASTRQKVDANTQQIQEVQRSLQREYYNFELPKGGGYLKVFNIALSLKDTDFSRRRYDLYVLADGKTIQKKDQSINEPLLFYVGNLKKPYEVVVTRVEKNYVVGYLSIPEEANP